MSVKTTVAATLAGLASLTASAVEYTWIGGASGRWNIESNWQPSGVPGGGDTAYVPGETEFTDDITISSGTLTVTSAVSVVSFKGVISGEGRLRLWGCGEKRLYRDNTYSGGTEIKGTGYRADGTLIPWNGYQFGDSGAVRIYSGGALGSGTAVFDIRESKDSSDGTLNNLGVRLYIESDENVTVTTPLDIGFNRDGKQHICIDAPEVVFASSIKVTGARLNVKTSEADQKCRFQLPLTVPGYFSPETGRYYLDDTYTIGTINPGSGCKVYLSKHGVNTYLLRNSGTIICGTNDVFDSSVPRIGDFTEPSVIDLNGYNQTFSAFNAYLDGNGNIRSKDGYKVFSPDDTPAFLSFVGLGEGDPDVVFNGVLKGSAGICWAPSSSDSTISMCSTKESDTVGELVVSSGVMEVDCAMPSLSRVTVCEGATLRLTDSALADFALLHLEISSAGFLELGSASSGGLKTIAGITVVDAETGAKSVLERGKLYAATASEGVTALPWLKGSAFLDMADMSHSVWLSAVDGLWSDAAKWSAGVPLAGCSATISAAGEDFTVTVDKPSSVSNLTVRSLGRTVNELNVASRLDSAASALVVKGSFAKFSVPAGGTFRYDGTGYSAGSTAKDALVVSGGGELSLAGNAVFTNVTGTIRVGGDSDVVSRLSVSGNGVLDLNFRWSGSGSTSHGVFSLLENGLIDVSGNGVLRRSCIAQKEYFMWKQDGGNMIFRDFARYSVGEVWENCFQPGETVFMDDSRFETDVSPRVYFSASGAGKLCKVSFLDRSRYLSTISAMTEVKPTNGGKAEILFDSDAVHELGYLIVGRNNAGTTSITLKRGHLGIGGSGGLLLAGGAGMYAGYGCVATGTVRVAGGSMTVNGASGGSGRYITGFVVGDGKAQVGSPQAYGRLELSGGAVTNVHEKSVLALGVGRALGEIVQTGGEFVSLATSASSPMIVGIHSGIGLYALSNGTARISGDIYVGGCSTGTLHRVFNEDRSALTDCSGTVRVAAADPAQPCDFHAGGRTVVGGLGRGTLEVGLGGTFHGVDLVLSNNTSSVMKIAVGDSGAGLVNLSGRLTVTPGAVLEIDATALSGSAVRAPILRFAGRDGDFDAENIVITGAGKGRIRRLAAGYDFVIPRGTQIILR